MRPVFGPPVRPTWSWPKPRKAPRRPGASPISGIEFGDGGAVAHPFGLVPPCEAGDRRADVAFEKGEGRAGGRRVEAAVFDDAREAEPTFHGRDDELARRHHDGGARHHVRLPELEVVAAFGFEGDVDTELAGERAGPDARGDHGGVAGDRSRRPCGRR